MRLILSSDRAELLLGRATAEAGTAGKHDLGAGLAVEEEKIEQKGK